VVSTAPGPLLTGTDPAPDPGRPRRRGRSAAPARGLAGGRTPRLLPYGLLLPASAVLALVLGYPLVRLVLLSVHEYGLRQQFGAPARWVGLANYRRILADPQFRAVLWRTLVLCAVCVALTMLLGLAVALLLNRLGKAMRVLVGGSLLLAWAIPPVSATVVWQWMFDTQNGVVNWLLVTLGADSFRNHSWLSDPLSFLAVAALVVIWMGVPFVAFTLAAGLSQIPPEIVEAAELDGAGAWQRFRLVTLPYLRPLIAILTALSVLWDIRVFTQIYVLQKAGGISSDTDVLGVYAYRISIGSNHFDTGAAAAVLMIVLTLLLTAYYLRQMSRQEEL
jgi:N,N'-diacetylchitobiose transport system permease protein